VIERLTVALADRYRIERELGQGGMATVYLAQDLKHDRRVAIKVLKPELAAVVGGERFLAEIRTTANLRHPHILPLFDSGDAGGFLWYAMPYVEGETLREKLDREKQLPVDEAVATARKVAGALQAAHDAGVIHRDIKPANILLEKGEPVVADFGIALAVQEAGGGRLTDTGLRLGTPYYMSPEQATGDRDPDARSDVYALGAVLYEMLTGEPPFTGTTAQAVLARILTEDLRPVTELRRTVPPHVEAAVAKAVEKLPADRFERARGFADALGDPAFTHASGVSGRSRTRSPAGAPRRRISPWQLATAAALIGAAGFAGGALFDGTPDVSRLPAEFVVTTLAVSQIDLSELVERFAVSPDGEHILFRSEAVPGSDEERLMLRRLGTLEPEPFDVDGYAPAFSPDGRYAAFTVGGRLFTTPIDGSEPLTEFAAIPAASSISWKDPDRIMFRTAGGGNQVYHMASPTPGSPVDSILVRGDTLLRRAESLGDERFLLSLSVGERDVIAVRESGRITKEIVQGRNATLTPTGHLLFARRASDRWTLVAIPFDVASAEAAGDEILLSSDIPFKYALPAAVTTAGDLYLLEGPPRADRRILVLDREGRELDAGFQSGPWEWLSVSPTGSRVAGQRWDGRNRSLWVGDLASGRVDRLTFDGDRFGPTWNPTGDRIAFTYFPDAIGADGTLTSMWWTAADGSEEILPLGARRDAYPESFHPDGRSLFYRYLGGNGSDIRRLSLEDGGEDSAVLDSRAGERWAVVSPDGRWLAYISSAPGSPELRVAPVSDVSSPTPIPSGDDVIPIGWRGDSRRLFYRLGGDVWEVAVGPDGPDPATSRVAFELPDDVVSASILPDGERLVIVRGGPILADLVVRQGALPAR